MKKTFLYVLLCLPFITKAQYTIHQLDSILQYAVASHQSAVIIPPGTYRGNVGGGHFIEVHNANNLQIIADNVKMICERRARAIDFINCSNVKLQGITIDYDSLCFTQGDVVAKGSNYIDVKIHQGYPVAAWSRTELIDPGTHYRKRGALWAWHTTAQIFGGDTVRITNTDNPNLASFTSIGDIATMSTGTQGGNDAPNALCLSDCQGGMELKNVTINCAPGFGIFESGGEGGTHLDGCKVVPGPKPAGAAHDRYLSTSWDAIQHKLTRRGPLVENCTVELAGDDTWSVTWDGDYKILWGGGSTITVSRGANLRVGDSLRSSLSSPVVYITSKVDSTLTLNTTCPWTTGTHLYSPSRRCENFVLRNNYFHSAGRVLIKSGHGLIENNVFDNMFNGVTVHNELGGDGAAGISSIVIRNNDIKGSGHFASSWDNVQAGSICILNSGDTISGVGVYDSIYIEKNKFTDISGVNIVVTSASNVHINENIFEQTGMSTPNATGGRVNIPQQTVVYLKNCADVTLDTNFVHTPGLDSLLIAKYVSNLTKLRRGIFSDGIVPFNNVTPYCCSNFGGNAFDKKLNTFVDAAAANGAYTGLDYQRIVTLDSIRYYPRPNFQYRMTGGQFQGSLDGINYTTIYTVPTEPILGWTAVPASGNYQYLRYLSPNGGYCNVTEIEFITHVDSSNSKLDSLPPIVQKIIKKLTADIKILPNPVIGNNLYITGLNKVYGWCNIVLSDMSGRVLQRQWVNDDNKPALYKLDMSNTTRGMYILTINTLDGFQSFKVIKL